MGTEPTPRRRKPIDRCRSLVLLVWAAGTLFLLLRGDAVGSVAGLWPSLIAVTLAFVTREIYSSLFLGALAGAVLLRGGSIFEGLALGWIDLFATHLLGALNSRWNLSILAFTLMMGGLVELLHRNGSMQALASRMLRSSRSRRRAGLSAFAMGGVVFFDGLANSMLVGKTMRATADRAGMSREKLAFIVDSTSSPIASVALVSTWIVTEMSLIQEGLANAAGGPEISAYGLLVQSLPYRFYSFFLLVMVFGSIWMQRDLGPMVEVERARRESDGGAEDNVAAGIPTVQGRLWVAIAPLVTLVVGVLGGLYVQGGGLETSFSLQGAIEALGRAEADLVFVCASATAILVALVATTVAGGLPDPVAQSSTRETALSVVLDGMRQMFLPAVILVLAWTLNATIGKLGAADVLVDLLDGRLPAVLLPAAVFGTAALVSFSTGTSWGTMAIVVPLAVPLAVGFEGDVGGPLLLATIGAVLAGSVFGDHCSPISDTTLVSSIACDCEPMEHVRTQLPYALMVALLAVAVGYVPTAMGVPVWLLLPLGAGLAWGFLRFRGRSVS